MTKTLKILHEINHSKSGIYRIFMSLEEIKLCNKLVKIGLLYKGKPDEKNSTVAFYITDKGKNYLDEYLTSR